MHDAYLRLVDREFAQYWNCRGHFFAAAAEAMRRLLVESARQKHRQKRGGGRRRIHLEDVATLAAADDDSGEDLLALDEALVLLATEDAKKAELVKLRYFADLTLEEAAQILDISLATAKRHWIYARAWLYGKLGDE